MLSSSENITKENVFAGVDKTPKVCYNTDTKKRKEMIKMLELIYRIPEHIGWMLVGAVGAYVSVAGWMLGATIYKAIKERMEDEECED